VLASRVNKTASEQFPRIKKKRAVYRFHEFVGTVLGWEPDRFMYRAGPVPTGFANPASQNKKIVWGRRGGGNDLWTRFFSDPEGVE
jgi:hypothetical protein